MIKIVSSIAKFQTVSLKELDGVKLLNRIDTKFICGISTLPEILDEISQNYRILEIGGKSIMSYKTNYFDTAGFKMYNEHQNGKLNRFKIREREYTDSDVNFLEVKFKNNKGRTLKSRTLRSESLYQFTKDESIFLQSQSPFIPEELEFKLCNYYKRITLTNNIERVTIDFDMKFISNQGETISLPSLVIVEVKQKKKTMDSPVITILKKNHIRSNGFSKYCIGSMMLYNNLKSNRFKSKIQLINKLKN
jgi:hypothetical protein